MDNLPFSTWSHLEEIKLRGTYVNMAVDIDFILAMAIVQCFRGREYEIEEYFDKELQDLSMFQKIEVIKNGLLRYYASFYNDHIADINSINRLRTFRNKLAHRKMDWDMQSENRSKFFLIKMKREEGLIKEEYNRELFWRELINFKDTTLNFLGLIVKFISENQLGN